MSEYTTLLYRVEGRVAYITLNRPERLNAINLQLPLELKQAIERANLDPEVHVIVLSGSGRAFSSGYDLQLFAESKGHVPGSQKMPWDPYVEYLFFHFVIYEYIYQIMGSCTECFMSIWRSLKPVIAKVNGPCIAGGSDIALCCDLIIMADHATIGYPPARVWGCPTTFMWVYRLGIERAKRLLFTGDVIDAKTALQWGLITSCVPASQLDQETDKLVKRIASVPKNQLMFQKLTINKAYEMMGLSTVQTLATLFDGMARHSPEGIEFKKRCEEVGFKQAVIERDQGLTVKSKL